MEGSLINRVYENQRGVAPVVGLPVTITHYSDRSVGIIVEVSPSGKQVKVAGVKATRVDDRGMSDWQSYEYGGEPVDTDHTSMWTLRKNGRFAQPGQPMRGGQGLILGVWDYHYDYSF